jgi:hypothetical protein
MNARQCRVGILVCLLVEGASGEPQQAAPVPIKGRVVLKGTRPRPTTTPLKDEW